MTQEPEAKGQEQTDEAHAGALVPVYGGTEIVPGIQAFRRGNAILYTVRGEPREVQELMSQLDEAGVDEVIALISHEAQDELAEPDEDTPPADEG
jgi:hypothetical protein